MNWALPWRDIITQILRRFGLFIVLYICYHKCTSTTIFHDITAYFATYHHFTVRQGPPAYPCWGDRNRGKFFSWYKANDKIAIHLCTAYLSILNSNNVLAFSICYSQQTVQQYIGSSIIRSSSVAASLRSKSRRCCARRRNSLPTSTVPPKPRNTSLKQSQRLSGMGYIFDVVYYALLEFSFADYEVVVLYF